MNQSNDRDGSRDNKNRGRPRNRDGDQDGGQDGNRRKRQRDNSESPNSREQSSHKRNRPSREQQIQLELIRQGQNLRASVIPNRGMQVPQLLRDVDMSLNATEEVAERMRFARPGELRLIGSVTGGRRRYGLNKHEELRRLEEARWKRAREALRASGPFLAPKNLFCKICKSNTHEANNCSKLNAFERTDLPQRERGFKRWCPRHQNDSHGIDDCRQRWTWLRDEKQVRRWLVEDCNTGPAFATNLLDWRTLSDSGSYSFIEYPWTPEFALKQREADRFFHERPVREIDPLTSDIDQRIELDFQTANGQPPQFETYKALKEHAEAQYQQFQLKIKINKQLAAAERRNKLDKKLARMDAERAEVLQQRNAIDAEFGGQHEFNRRREFARMSAMAAQLSEDPTLNEPNGEAPEPLDSSLGQMIMDNENRRNPNGGMQELQLPNNINNTFHGKAEEVMEMMRHVNLDDNWFVGKSTGFEFLYEEFRMWIEKQLEIRREVERYEELSAKLARLDEEKAKVLKQLKETVAPYRGHPFFERQYMRITGEAIEGSSDTDGATQEDSVKQEDTYPA